MAQPVLELENIVKTYRRGHGPPDFPWEPTPLTVTFSARSRRAPVSM